MTSFADIYVAKYILRMRVCVCISLANILTIFEVAKKAEKVRGAGQCVRVRVWLRFRAGFCSRNCGVCFVFVLDRAGPERAEAYWPAALFAYNYGKTNNNNTAHTHTHALWS